MRLAHAHWQSLRNAQQFAAVMQQGHIVGRSPHFVLHALRWAEPQPDEQRPVQTSQRELVFSLAQPCFLGAIIPKRLARRAVTRNLVKRQIRHVVPACIAAPEGHLAVVVRQKAAFDARSFISAHSPALRAAVRQELLQLAQSPDWQALKVKPHPPRKAKAVPHPSGTMQPAASSPTP